MAVLCMPVLGGASTECVLSVPVQGMPVLDMPLGVYVLSMPVLDLPVLGMSVLGKSASDMSILWRGCTVLACTGHAST